MKLYAVLLISKNGSLLHHHHVEGNGESPLGLSPLKRQSPNDLLVIASNLHGIHAIASQLTPDDTVEVASGRRHCNRSGLRSVHCEEYNIYIDQSVSGLKICAFTAPDVVEEQALRLSDVLYRGYCDYVLKTPFYTMDMPIRVSSFDNLVQRTVAEFNSGSRNLVH